MRVLVTGASGFIGSALLPALVASGDDVARGPREPAALAESLTACHALVHLANLAHAAADADALWKVNVEGTRRVAEAAAVRGVQRMIYLSSIKASGEETGIRPFDGAEAPAPADAYGRAKLAAEQALFEVAARSGLEVVVLRPPLVYGPGVKGNFFALMRALARGLPLPLAGISNKRSLIYVGNLVQAIIRCLRAAGAPGRVYTVSDAAPLSTTALCLALGEALAVRAKLFWVPPRVLELLPGGTRLTRSLVVDDGALRNELGWRPPCSAEEGLQATVSWYRGYRL